MSHSAQEIQDWIVRRVSGMTGIPACDVDPNAPFLRHGLDSVAVVALVADLEIWLGYRFRQNPLEEYPTIASLASYLAAQVAKK
jgi:acyl carrier protein